MDALVTRMKAYEDQETQAKFLPGIPVYARIDGRGFSRFTRGLAMPCDMRFREAMIDTTRWLVETTQASMGYTQSDEINLCWIPEALDKDIFFSGRKQKMVSQLAALATQRFNAFWWRLSATDPFAATLAERAPTFDARACALPSLSECVNAFLWREQDATRNALSMAARTHYKHKDLLGKRRSELHDLLMAKGINFNDYPALFKRGVYVQRRQVVKELDEGAWNAIPPQHRPLTRTVLRTDVCILDLPPLSSVANREAVFFEQAEAQLVRASDAPESVKKEEEGVNSGSFSSKKGRVTL